MSLKRSDVHHLLTALTSALRSRRFGGIRGMLPASGTEEARREKSFIATFGTDDKLDREQMTKSLIDAFFVFCANV